MEKNKVPQLSKNYVSCDYVNEFNALFLIVDGVERLGEEKYRKVRRIGEKDYLLKDANLPKLYEERFNPDFYEDVINEKNFRRVRRINDLTLKIKSGLENKSTDFEEFRKNARAIVYFIRGDKV